MNSLKTQQENASSKLPIIHSTPKIRIKLMNSQSPQQEKKSSFSLTKKEDPSIFKVFSPQAKKNSWFSPKHDTTFEMATNMMNPLFSQAVENRKTTMNFQIKNRKSQDNFEMEKFYLEYHKLFRPAKKKFLTRQEICDLIGVDELNLDVKNPKLQEVLDSYPNTSFLDFSELVIKKSTHSNSVSPVKNNDNEKIDSKNNREKWNLTEKLIKIQHTSQNNPEKNRNQRFIYFEMAEFLEKASKKILESNEKIIDKQEVFSFENACRSCISNIVAEISKDCLERGALLESIWDLNCEVLQLYIRKIENFTKNIENDFIKKLGTINESYCEKIDALNKQVKKQQEITSQQEETLKKLEEETHLQKKKSIHYEKKIKHIESEFEKFRESYNIIFQENIRFKIKKVEDSNITKEEKNKLMKVFEELQKSYWQMEKKRNFSESPKIFEELLKKNKDLNYENDPILRQFANNDFNFFEFSNHFSEILFEKTESSLGDNSVEYLDVAVATDEPAKKTFVEQEIQTVFFDEILEENSMDMQSMNFNSMNNFNEKGKDSHHDKMKNSKKIHLFHKQNSLSRHSSNEYLKKYQGNNETLLSRHSSCEYLKKFQVNNEAIDNLTKILDINNLSIKEFIEYYSTEMKTFYNLLMKIAEDYMDDEQTTKDIDWYVIYENIQNNKAFNDHFLNLLLNNDRAKLKQLYNQKIEIVQKGFDFIEKESNFKLIERKYNKLSKNLQEYFPVLLNEEFHKLEQLDFSIINVNNTCEENITSINNIPLDNKESINLNSNGDNSVSPQLKKKNSLMSDLPILGKLQKRRSLLIVNEQKNENIFINEKINSQKKIKKIDSQKKIERKPRRSLLNIIEITDGKLVDETCKFISQGKITLKFQTSTEQYSSLFLIKMKEYIERNNDKLTTENLGHFSVNNAIKAFSPFLLECLKKVQKISHENVYLNPFFHIFYEYTYKKHSLSKESTEAKILKLIESCLFYKKFPRIRIILMLLGIEENNEGDDLLFYLENIKNLDDTLVGFQKSDFIDLSNNVFPGANLLIPLQESVKIGLAKALDNLIKYLKKSLPEEHYKLKLEEIVNKIKADKTSDPLISRKHVVDVNLVIEQMFWIRNESFLQYKIAFDSIDIEGNDALNINGFSILIRNVEKTVNDNKIKEIFLKENNCLDENKTDCINFKRFCGVCEKYKWLSKKNLQVFENSVVDEILNYDLLIKEWDIKQPLIKLKLIKANSYNMFYNKIFKRIDELIEKKEKGKSWFLYRIIDDESNRILLDHEVKNLLPPEFQELIKIMK